MTSSDGQRAPTPNRGGDSDRRAVMAQVAHLAGVSQMTVSRVINNTAPVRPETRARVVAAMEQLNYQPNPAARALATGRSRVLGVVAYDTTLFGPASTLLSIQQAAQQAGYFVTTVSPSTLDRASIGNAVDHLQKQTIDGVVVMTPNSTAVEALDIVPRHLPAVAVQGGYDAPVPAVCIDQAAGAVLATQHLLSLGHETVWHISGPEDWIEAQVRERAWRRTLTEGGREIPEVLRGNWSARSGYELGRELIAEGRATAVFSANDHMALGLYRALREADIALPDQMSVVGFDDVPEAAYLAPPLTTVRQNFAEVGREALRLLIQQLEGRSRETPSRMVDAELVLRDSTGPASRRATRRRTARSS